MSDLSARNIKRYRKQKGFTQEQLAEAVGISVMSIRRYETKGKNNREPSANLFDKIAEKLGTTADILRGKISDYDFKDVPAFPTTNEDTMKVYFKNKQRSLAAHFDSNEYTEEELNEIRHFAEFLKYKREKPITNQQPEDIKEKSENG